MTTEEVWQGRVLSRYICSFCGESYRFFVESGQIFGTRIRAYGLRYFQQRGVCIRIRIMVYSVVSGKDWGSFVESVKVNPWQQLGLPVGLVLIVALLISQISLQSESGKAPPVVQNEITNSIGMTLVEIEPGRFTMGGEDSGVSSEVPVRQVKVAPFYMGKYEVTQAQWLAVMGKNPSEYKDPRRPVDQVTWIEVQEFIQRLNQMEKTDKYRLPSEAEWEYAARAGQDGPYGFDGGEDSLAKYAWYGHEGNVGTRPVGQRRANAWGLYDMHGNVWEWVEDCWHDDYTDAPTDSKPWLAKGDCATRVLKGGGWNSDAFYVRSRVRGSYGYDLNDVGNGFRLAKSP